MPLEEEKIVGPTSHLTFHELDINTVSQTVLVPGNKLKGIQEKIEANMQSSKNSLRSLQSFMHSLTFICQATSPGRYFSVG